MPNLVDYIKYQISHPLLIDWKKNGHMDKVLLLAKEWIEKHRPDNTIVHIKRKEKPKFFRNPRR